MARDILKFPGVGGRATPGEGDVSWMRGETVARDWSEMDVLLLSNIVQFIVSHVV